MTIDETPDMAYARASVEAAIAAMDRLDETLRVVITRTDDSARERAVHADALAAENRSLGPLHGWTVALKDNIDTGGIRTTSGSRFFAHHVPVADAFVVDRLRGAGAVFTAKVNLAEFALGATTHNDHWGTCRNAWDPRRIPGGSSGGSAVAVAAGMAKTSLGTDTGGSVRIPASVNGLVGLRPTLGRISNSGVTPVSAAFDTVGPIARTAAEVAQMFAVLDAFDVSDPTCQDLPRTPVLEHLHRPVDGLVVGVPRQFFFADLDPTVETLVRDAIGVLQELDCRVVEVDLPGASDAQRHMFDIIYPDAAAFHERRMAEQPELFGPEVHDRLRLGEGVDARTMSVALDWRRAWHRRVERVLDGVDVVVSPTLPGDVPLVGGGGMIATTHDIARFTYAWAMFGGPSVSVPCGFHSGSGMPVGLHLTARPWHDHTVLQFAHAYQSATTHHHAVSPLASED